ncbi:MAG TPA: S8 family serine peptidase [Thermoanaerobaculia bacterium]|nr:S8 family serine peptidase [Thermoanaerobaculia bacterium]
MTRRTLGCLVTLLFLALPAAAQVATTSVILELNGDPGAVYKAKRTQQGLSTSAAQLDAYRAQLTSAQNAVISAATARGLAVSLDRAAIYGADHRVAGNVDLRYTLVYNGVAVTVPVTQVAALAAVPGVKSVHRSQMLKTQLDHSVPYIKADKLYGTPPALGPYDLPRGIEGQGMVVAVIDTGVEWSHEMFGGDPTPPRLGIAPPATLVGSNQKVVYYLPFGDLAVEDGVGHGTHVSSTAAGYRGYTAGPDSIPLNADDVPIHGVAPQAKLMVYGVCANVLSIVGSLTGAIGGCLNEYTMLALEDAVSPRTLTGYAKPVANVINLSLGGEYGTADDPTAVACSNAAIMGAVVVAAAGNSGDVAGIVGAPSTGTRVISVAATNDAGVAPLGIDPLDAAGNRLTGAPLIRAAASPQSNGAQPYRGGISGNYVFAGLADTPDQVPPSVAGNICLVERGSTAEESNTGEGTGLWANKAANCKAQGAVATVGFNNAPGPVGEVLAPSADLVATISREDGLYLKDTLGFDANGVSKYRIHITGPDSALFQGEIAGFSSRGPVAGLGQIKPDVAAPGVAIVAAVPPASMMGGLAAADTYGPNYGEAQGTSMATPHVTGAAALIKQANPTWHPDYVRTALQNTATPFRDAAGNPGAYGSGNFPIHAQGAGLIDVAAAAKAKALLGVKGDGVIKPFILGSHSFGAFPIVGNECSNPFSVGLDLVDLRGTGGTYTLRAYPNRDTEPAQASFTLPATVTVPPNGSAHFDAGIAVAGNALRDVQSGGQADLQWYVVAERTDGTEKLAMPMLLRATPSVPGASIGGVHDVVETFEDTVPGGTPAVVFQSNNEISVPAGTMRIQAKMDGDDVVTGVPAPTEVDLYLLYEDGSEDGVVVASSTSAGNHEYLDYTSPVPGTYNVRVRSETGGPVSYTMTVTQTQAATPDPASLAALTTEYVDQTGQAVDFDGAFTLSWTGGGHETGFSVEQKSGGGDWQRLALAGPAARSFALSGLQNGSYEYRVVAQYPGAVCTYVAAPSNARGVTVERRQPVDATGTTRATISRTSFSNGVMEVDFVLRNDGSAPLLNPVTLSVVGVSSPDVRVLNADNGGGGTSRGDAATFSYAANVGGETLAPGETSAPRTVRFADPNGELFRADVLVSAYAPAP